MSVFADISRGCGCGYSGRVMRGYIAHRRGHIPPGEGREARGLRERGGGGSVGGRLALYITHITELRCRKCAIMYCVHDLPYH